MGNGSENTILIGIDEAGLGPLLGPLVISAAGLSVPRELLKEDLWQLLKESVKKDKKQLAGRMLVTDSKKAFNRSAGLGHLERTVLSSLAALGDAPDDIGRLLNALCPDCAGRIEKYKWYNENISQPIEANPDEIGICSASFSRALKKNQMSLVLLKSFCFDVAYYNGMVEKVRNKSTVVFTALCGLISDVLKHTEGKAYQFLIDRQGGRSRYTEPLRKMFPEMALEVLKESEKISSYELADSQRVIRLHFMVKADAKHFPVSLASMTSKYLREILMGCINKYFISRCEKIQPTAGYWTDGKRFVKDLKTYAGYIEYDLKELIRSR